MLNTGSPQADRQTKQVDEFDTFLPALAGPTWSPAGELMRRELGDRRSTHDQV